MQVFVLLDRSGSMSSRWEEALSAINCYVEELGKADATKEAKVSLATFDLMSGLCYETIRSGVLPTAWPRVKTSEVAPRGSTPLYDAIGRVVAQAEATGDNDGIVVTMTDGEENASREVRREGARAAFDRLRAKGWQTVFLGADFDAMRQAGDVGTSAANTMSMAKGSYGVAAAALARNTARYSTARARGDVATANAAMTFTDEDRKQARGVALRPKEETP